jgi:flagellin-like hook-associated protein FlgL
MRSTLISLQGSVKLLDRTQNRLATGKKVNSALDNPVSFFTSVSLTDRASRLHGLKDTTSEAIQTLKTADRGIAALSTMIEQAKSIAEKALSASSTGSATATGSISLNGIVGYKGAVQPSYDAVILTLTGLQDNNPGGDGDFINLKVDGLGGVYPVAAESGVPGYYSFHLDPGDMDATALNMANKINSINWSYWKNNVNPAMNVYYRAEYLGSNQLRITKFDYSTSNQLNVEAGDIAENPGNAGDFDPQIASYTPPLPSSDTIGIGGATFTAIYSGVPGVDEFIATAGDNAATMQSLAAAIEAHDWSGGTYTFHASVSGGTLNIEKVDNATGLTVHVTAGDFDTSGIIGGGSGSMSLVASSNELAVLEAQYNTMRSQLTTLALDSYYKGKNLLAAQNMTVRFEQSSLLVAGFDASAAGLGITEATWTTGGDINADITLLESALARLRRGSADMSNNLSIITARQTFSETMENILTEGSDRLTLADTSEEGANMLMLQTRQSLSMNVLSLAADAAQSVLQLFR